MEKYRQDKKARRGKDHESQSNFISTVGIKKILIITVIIKHALISYPEITGLQIQVLLNTFNK